MITLLYQDFHVEFPFPPAQLQLLTAIKIGFGRLEKEEEFEAPKAFNVRLDGTRIYPNEAERVLSDNSTISILPVDIDVAKPEQNFIVVLDD